MKLGIVIIFILFFHDITNSQESLKVKNIVNYFTQIKSRNFDYSYITSTDGYIFVAYRGTDPGDVEKLYLDVLDLQGNFVREKLHILNDFIFTQGYQNCYTNDNEVKIVVGFWKRPGVVATYNIKTSKINILSLEDINLSAIRCTYDQDGTFHLLTLKNHKAIYVKIFNDQIIEKREISYNSGILYRNLLKMQNIALLNNERAPTLSNNFSTFYYNNQLGVIYYLDRAPLKYAPPEAVSENYFDRIGIEMLNLNNYSFSELKIYDIEEYTVEKVENIFYPKIKIFSSPDNDKPLEVYLGGKNGKENNLCKIVLNENFEPIRPLQQKLVAPILEVPLSKNNIWDFVIEYRDPFTLKSCHFVGFEKDKIGEIKRFYYTEKSIK